VTIRLPRLPQQEPTWDQMQLWWQTVVEAIEAQEERQDEAIAAIEAAQNAAAEAVAAAATAQAAADVAQEVAEGATGFSTIVNSYPLGVNIYATDAGSSAQIEVFGHSRVYLHPDGTSTSVPVDGHVFTGLLYSTDYWISYSDPDQQGGAVTYSIGTAAPAQFDDRHVVGAVQTPAPAGALRVGNPLRVPGYVEP
jgi:hypothetical protein